MAAEWAPPHAMSMISLPRKASITRGRSQELESIDCTSFLYYIEENQQKSQFWMAQKWDTSMDALSSLWLGFTWKVGDLESIPNCNIMLHPELTSRDDPLKSQTWQRSQKILYYDLQKMWKGNRISRLMPEEMSGAMGGFQSSMDILKLKYTFCCHDQVSHHPLLPKNTLLLLLTEPNSAFLLN